MANKGHRPGANIGEKQAGLREENQTLNSKRIYRHDPLYIDKVTLTLENGVLIRVNRSPREQNGDIRVNPMVFPKMLLGCRSIGELESEYPDVRVRPQYSEIMNLIFPKSESHIHTTY